MKTDNIRIKRKNSDFLLCGVLYLLLILVGIFLIGLPFLSFAPSGGSKIFLVILGILCIGTGGTLYGLLLYRGICPPDALIITNKGMTNYLTGGKDGVYVEWINVSSMKVFGLSKAPMLGLSLENNDSYLSMLNVRSAREAQSNLDVGLPIIAIAQKDIFLPIGELKNLFSRMIKGAISWESYSTQSKKPASPADPPSAPPSVMPVRRPSTAGKPKAAPTAPPPAAEQVNRPEQPAFTPVKPAAAPEPEKPDTPPEDPPVAPQKPAGQPKTPEAPVQEEIILLDIDND